MAFHNVPPNGFPDLPDVEELEAVEKDVATLKSTATSQGEAITELLAAVPTKTPKSDIAPTFSEEDTYAVGDLVYYEGVLYECTTAHEVAEWDAGDFTATNIDKELSAINSNLTNVIALLNGLRLTTASLASQSTIRLTLSNHTGIMIIITDRGALVIKGSENRGVHRISDIMTDSLDVTDVDAYSVDIKGITGGSTSVYIMSKDIVTISEPT